MGKHLKQKSAPVKTELKKKKYKSASVKPTPPRKTFLDMIAPGVMKFNPDLYIRDMYPSQARSRSGIKAPATGGGLLPRIDR